MLLLKYNLYYLVSHYHCIMLRRCITKTKQSKFFDNPKKFKKYVNKFCKHAYRFDELQISIDKLKEEMSAK